MLLFGLGTHQLTGGDLVHRVLEAALAANYRLIDTASVYRNETDIGTSLQKLYPQLNLNRSDIFITTKLGPKDQGYDKAYRACLKSIEKLQCEYLDLYLIHWPGRQKLKHDDEQNRSYRKESWRAMERLYKEGKVKSIGVSNYTIRHLEELLSHAEIPPSVLQVEFHPYYRQQELLDWCKEHNIRMQAYTSLGKGKLLLDPVVIQIAKKHGKKPSQVLLKWAVQQGIGVIPKSTNPEHIQDNSAIFDFELCSQDMDMLNGLHSNTKYCWDPSDIA
ncbi:glyoxal reductase-like [Anneissia japonica]|uniref:glyoxal reductase-like n=1 Tax=Anneissia japonica TaxID=1529436 RepID=UPI0014256B13|nr:glyoxal reductase-like [Anneissia japonica]XP_033103799.1 glyoxal reductase-like [Anneissia japonica]XP_033103800.1 glyoxal reductase-like [Anneissia japonica]XP_033103801.1 glyoxal reductase-like [Anneissia japonica]